MTTVSACSYDFQAILASRSREPMSPKLVAACSFDGGSSEGESGCTSREIGPSISTHSKGPMVRGSRAAEFLKQINQNEEARKSIKPLKTPGKLNVTLNIPMARPSSYYAAAVSSAAELRTSRTTTSLCSICKDDINGDGPELCELTCGHKFHTDCVQQLLSNAPKFGARFLMTYLRCPECRSVISHSQFDALVLPYQEKFERVLNALEKYGGEAEQKLVQSGVARIREDLFDSFVFFLCSCCGQPFFGGRKECQVEGAVDDMEPSNDRICVACQARMHNIDLSRQNASCAEHGTEFIAFKCKFCCRVAVWFCGGTTRYCEPCHNLGSHGVSVQPCNCGNNHTNGQEQCLGCVLCQSI